MQYFCPAKYSTSSTHVERALSPVEEQLEANPNRGLWQGDLPRRYSKGQRPEGYGPPNPNRRHTRAMRGRGRPQTRDHWDPDVLRDYRKTIREKVKRMRSHDQKPKTKIEKLTEKAFSTTRAYGSRARRIRQLLDWENQLKTGQLRTPASKKGVPTKVTAARVALNAVGRWRRTGKLALWFTAEHLRSLPPHTLSGAARRRITEMLLRRANRDVQDPGPFKLCLGAPPGRPPLPRDVGEKGARAFAMALDDVCGMSGKCDLEGMIMDAPPVQYGVAYCDRCQCRLAAYGRFYCHPLLDVYIRSAPPLPRASSVPASAPGEPPGPRAPSPTSEPGCSADARPEATAVPVTPPPDKPSGDAEPTEEVPRPASCPTIGAEHVATDPAPGEVPRPTSAPTAGADDVATDPASDTPDGSEDEEAALPCPVPPSGFIPEQFPPPPPPRDGDGNFADETSKAYCRYKGIPTHLLNGHELTDSELVALFEPEFGLVDRSQIEVRWMDIPYDGEQRLIVNRNVNEAKLPMRVAEAKCTAKVRSCPLWAIILSTCFFLSMFAVVCLLNSEWVHTCEEVYFVFWTRTVPCPERNILAVRLGCACLVVASYAAVMYCALKTTDHVLVLSWSPHWVDTVFSDFDRQVNKVTIESTLYAKMRRCAGLPVKDTMHYRLMQGTARVVETLLAGQGFQLDHTGLLGPWI